MYTELQVDLCEEVGYGIECRLHMLPFVKASITSYPEGA